jgi:hypothetical protein
MSEPTGHRERTPDHLASGLLHWLNFNFRQAKLIPQTSDRQLPFAGKKDFSAAFLIFCPQYYFAAEFVSNGGV